MNMIGRYAVSYAEEENSCALPTQIYQSPITCSQILCKNGRGRRNTRGDLRLSCWMYHCCTHQGSFAKEGTGAHTIHVQLCVNNAYVPWPQFSPNVQARVGPRPNVGHGALTRRVRIAGAACRLCFVIQNHDLTPNLFEVCATMRLKSKRLAS